MAFKADALTLVPGARGKGGVIRYFDGEDALNTIKGDGYWNAAIDQSSIDGQKNAEARAAAEDFVQAQQTRGAATARGVPIHIMSSNGQDMDVAYLDGGRIKIRNAAWSLKV